MRLIVWAGFPGITPDGVKSVSGDVLLRPADPDSVPMPVILVFFPGLQQLLHLIRWRVTTGKQIAIRDGQSHRPWM
jgi:hypothetical protein